MNPSAKLSPLIIVFTISDISIPETAGSKQIKASSAIYLRIEDTTYLFKYVIDIQKGIVYKHATGIAETITYKITFSTLIASEAIV